MGSWQYKAKEKATEYSEMNYDAFKNNIMNELALVARHSGNFGCLIFIIFGFLLSFYMLIKSLIEKNETLIGGMTLNIVVYSILVIWLYPKFTQNYKDYIKNMNKFENQLRHVLQKVCCTIENNEKRQEEQFKALYERVDAIVKLVELQKS